MRAQILGLSLAVDEGEGVYVPIGHRYLGAPKQLAWSEVAAAVAPVLADSEVKKIGYDVKRTENVLARHGVVLRGAISDPMLAAYLLDPEAPNELKDLVRREFGTELPVFDAGSGKKSDRIAFDQLDVERATTYAAPEAELALSLSVRLDPRVANDGPRQALRGSRAAAVARPQLDGTKRGPRRHLEARRDRAESRVGVPATRGEGAGARGAQVRDPVA
jgi:DNA polymerase-1